MELKTDDTAISLTSEDISIKITNDRSVWLKNKGESRYKLTSAKAPMGLSKTEKEEWLLHLMQKLIERVSKKNDTVKKDTGTNASVSISDDVD